MIEQVTGLPAHSFKMIGKLHGEDDKTMGKFPYRAAVLAGLALAVLLSAVSDSSAQILRRRPGSRDAGGSHRARHGKGSFGSRCRTPMSLAIRWSRWK